MCNILVMCGTRGISDVRGMYKVQQLELTIIASTISGHLRQEKMSQNNSQEITDMHLSSQYRSEQFQEL